MGNDDLDSPGLRWECSNCELIPTKSGYWVADSGCRLMVHHGPEAILRAKLIKLGEPTADGSRVIATAEAWREVRRQLKADPAFRFNFRAYPRKFEEFLAGLYLVDDWDEVILTSRSADKGRDVIASKSGLIKRRILEQAKAYSEHRRVTHNDVRAMVGVVFIDMHKSKLDTHGLVTTTSEFEPKITSGDEFAGVIPDLVSLRNGMSLATSISSTCAAVE